MITTETIDNLELGQLIPWYAINAYLYYEEDTNVMSDAVWDHLARRVYDNWKDIKHPHKWRMLKRDAKAGTFPSKGYSCRVPGAAHHFKKEYGTHV